MKLIPAFLAAAFVSTSLFASSFLISVDTSALPGGTTGFLDLQFNGSSILTPAGTATVTNFLGSQFDVDPSQAMVAGAVSGDLTPGPLEFHNTDAFNDYFVPFRVMGNASSFSFLVTIAGDILSPPPGNLNGTDFALLLLGADQMTPLLTNDGVLALLAVAATGEVSASAFAPGTIATGVPEPTTVMLVLSGLLLAIPLMRKAKD
jgi:hypothetical protein